MNISNRLIVYDPESNPGYLKEMFNMCMLEEKIMEDAFAKGKDVKIDLKFQGVHDEDFDAHPHFVVPSTYYMTFKRFASDIKRFRDMMLDCEHHKAVNLITD